MNLTFRKKTGALIQLLFFCLYLLFPCSVTAQPSNLLEGVYSEEQARQGEALYTEHCAHCHDIEFYKNSLATWNGMTVLDYWYRILGNMPADNPKSLSDDNYLAIVAWVLAINGYPTGPEPLSPGNYLGRLKIERNNLN